ncbi:Lrp/AsnC family transcriptional regulator [Candidatus Micrarchaeota archaeon]|nr:Lrp/AsnC family transcriptional regulator [Candidatus Micrarchaeota archaeon]
MKIGAKEKERSDEKIMDLLRDNSRLSFRAIAKKTGLATSTVAARVSRMESEGVITGYSASFDYEKLGYDLLAIITAIIQGQPLLKVQSKIAAMREVMSVYDVTGDYDSMVIVRVKNRKELSETVKKILATEGVARTNTHLVLNTVKENYAVRK